MLDTLFVADPGVGHDGRDAPGRPVERVLAVL